MNKVERLAHQCIILVTTSSQSFTPYRNFPLERECMETILYSLFQLLKIEQPGEILFQRVVCLLRDCTGRPREFFYDRIRAIPAADLAVARITLSLIDDAVYHQLFEFLIGELGKRITIGGNPFLNHFEQELNKEVTWYSL